MKLWRDIKEYNKIKLLHTYYKADRWPYYKDVIDYVINNLEITESSKVLELGPYLFNLFYNSETIDIESELSPTWLFDARKTPWPMPDKSYDLFIGLQVLEHLVPKQAEVFMEALRVSKYVIISLPYKWNIPGDIHHNIDENIINTWTGNLKPIYSKLIGSRIVLAYK